MEQSLTHMDIVRASGPYPHMSDVDLQHEVAEFDMSINNSKDKSMIFGIAGLLFVVIAAIVSIYLPGPIREGITFTYANGIPAGIGVILVFISLMFTMMHSSEESVVQSKRNELERRGLKPKLKEGT